jgi:phosphoenolpyruvate carboxykinase (GTP)
MGDYFGHWLRMGQRLGQPPLVFRVNWFRMNEAGKFLWPGFGENLRVLRWVLGRVHGEMGAAETPIGYLPHVTDLDTTGLDVTPAALQELLTVDRAGWREAVVGQQDFFKQFGDRMPSAMWHETNTLAHRLHV